MSSTLHVWRVVVFLYVGSHRLLHNLTDMCQKALAGLGLHVAMVPESYHCTCLQYNRGCSWRGKSREVVKGEVTITNKRSKGELVSQADKSSSEDEVQVVEAPRGEFLTVISRFATHRT
jgi:hypothetical protein